MKRFRFIAALILVASAVLFAVRHRSLRQLKSEQEALRQQIREAAKIRADEQAKADAASSVPTEVSLSAAERTELLRLRGQITRLRQELQETNQSASIARPRAETPGTPEEPPVTQEAAMARLSAGKQWMLALLLHAQTNQQRLAGSLSDARSFVGAMDVDDSFELVQSGLPLSSLKGAATTIVLREKRPWKREGGGWGRTYAFADGHTEIASSDTPDFSEWEKAKAARAQDAAR